MPAQPPLPEWISATTPKLGNSAGENEDAVAAAPEALRFAVSDGASEGWESGPWAGRLAAAFVGGPPSPHEFPAWLAEARRGWAQKPAAGPEAWYASVKQEQGSFATLLGLELRHSRSTSGWAWRAVAVGDSCLLHVRGGALQAAFPLATPKAFGNRPPLLPSSPDAKCPEPEWFAGRAEPEDLFLLATDAAAARLLDPPALAAALPAVREALVAGEPGPLYRWFREVQAVANDDVSLVAIRLPDAQELP
jgi:hypothetical protein